MRIFENGNISIKEGYEKNFVSSLDGAKNMNVLAYHSIFDRRILESAGD